MINPTGEEEELHTETYLPLLLDWRPFLLVVRLGGYNSPPVLPIFWIWPATGVLCVVNGLQRAVWHVQWVPRSRQF